ncbi:hypothetical protein XBP1_2380002 [Xenorhabdus bovienii str. puntauvense]|uniref:Uncharacterized protein n=4 Tax=Xenorhabdus bovienii TaxID=40576 RepID=A0A0B6X273_XENBV|nr:hypothetical protein XBFFR1_2390026 [Xenorhabdus bovienii str. feltiae France]CDG94664.1 hypothetical protein XBFFL1_850027 [Xenorhabdus bovienii str. feltiae Florida]CDG96925.1 hypothetical protein XBP1_2380002 [Xenorhabdus bovienii str. puntauvense]CDH03969.1 hypothetical protein XBFM1_900026 [Xenorhabdus bovienii str. feltiae Moldova]CDH23620.1 hypothetical protein XBKB1_1920013 [Xenorhabdus bovienii str. kraussei Becker Underwood]CDM87827.1 conserved protein of unknown function [Xenorha
MINLPRNPHIDMCCDVMKMLDWILSPLEPIAAGVVVEKQSVCCDRFLAYPNKH